MPPRPARAPRDEVSREQTHADIIGRIDSWGLELKQAHSELKGEMRGRFDGVDREIRGLRDSLERTTGRVAALEGDHEVRGEAAPATDPGHGLPFKAGWPFYLGAGAVAVSFFGGLQKAVETIGALFASLAHALTPH